jgi:hypothetical protein
VDGNFWFLYFVALLDESRRVATALSFTKLASLFLQNAALAIDAWQFEKVPEQEDPKKETRRDRDSLF